jgi:hypothetical protein
MQTYHQTWTQAWTTTSTFIIINFQNKNTWMDDSKSNKSVKLSHPTFKNNAKYMSYCWKICSTMLY